MTSDQARRIADFIAPLRVEPGGRVQLPKDFDPGYCPDGLTKESGQEQLKIGIEVLAEYQDRLAAQNIFGVLFCLQAMDAAGKDGTIRHVMSGVNAQGVHVNSFKVPSNEELDHDFLWRYAKALPRRGEIGIFNRSHYEEVLVVRVHPELLGRQHLPAHAREGIWKRRYDEINAWEKYLVDNGIAVVKVFLNVSREEQRNRFMERIDHPHKNWKFSAADIAERQHWDAYQAAYSEMLSHTSTPWAPWYVVPADRKWFMRMCAAAILGNALITIDPHYPTVSPEVRLQLAAARAELVSEG